MEPRRREPLRAPGREPAPQSEPAAAHPPDPAPTSPQPPGPSGGGTYQPSWSPQAGQAPGAPSSQVPHYDATAGLVFGILGYVLGGLFFHIPAFIMGRRARRVREAGGTEQFGDVSYWLGLVGIILAAAALVFGVIALIAVIAFR